MYTDKIKCDSYKKLNEQYQKVSNAYTDTSIHLSNHRTWIKQYVAKVSAIKRYQETGNLEKTGILMHELLTIDFDDAQNVLYPTLREENTTIQGLYNEQ